MHTREEKEPSVFAQGIEGWKMLFSKFKKKPQQEQQQNNESSMANANS